MHIVASSNLNIQTEQQLLFGREVTESLQLNNGAQSVNYQRHEKQLFASAEQMQVSSEPKPALSKAALDSYAKSISPAESRSASLANTPQSESALADFAPDEADVEKLRMLLAALARLNGDFSAYQEMLVKFSQNELADFSSNPAPVNASVGAAAVSAPPNNAAPSLSYDYHVTQWQQQELKVHSSGSLTTADGRTIDFNFAMHMQHTQASHESVSIRAGAALKDPLVINYAASSAQLSSQQMQFDLDANGRKESLAMLGNGSAYLALDKNGNGRIDDGRELFGALSGDGFADLARYDDDGNGFIDSADAVFKDLKLWLPDSQGKGRLLSLADAGIGALALQHAQGSFELIANNELQGQVRSNGIFVFEDGRIGSMQQVDLVV